jgi:hypothetical protein
MTTPPTGRSVDPDFRHRSLCRCHRIVYPSIPPKDAEGERDQEPEGAAQGYFSAYRHMAEQYNFFYHPSRFLIYLQCTSRIHFTATNVTPAAQTSSW